MIWLFKKSVSLFYRLPKPTFQKFKLSIITAVYNEDPVIFEKAIFSWKRRKPFEIIAVIDYTDFKNIDLFKSFSQRFEFAKLIVTRKPGKRPALAEGIRASSGDILALVDSDTVWNKMPKTKIFAPFRNPSVGGATVRQEILKSDTLARKLFSIQLSDRYFTEYPFLSVLSGYLNCLSGRTALYRREALMQVLDEMENEIFGGKQAISGEDKSLTNLIQARGWKTKYLRDACVKTSGAPDMLTYLKQRVRWSRNSWRADLKTVFSGWVWKRGKILALNTIDRFIQPFILLLAPLYFIFAVASCNWIMVKILLLWWVFSRSIKNISHFTRHPFDFIILPFYILNSFLLNILKIYALLTLTRQGWITRWNKNRIQQVQ